MSNKEIPSAGRAVYEGDTDRYEKGPSPQQENVGFRMGEPGDDENFKWKINFYRA